MHGRQGPAGASRDGFAERVKNLWVRDNFGWCHYWHYFGPVCMPLEAPRGHRHRVEKGLNRFWLIGLRHCGVFMPPSAVHNILILTPALYRSYQPALVLYYTANCIILSQPQEIFYFLQYIKRARNADLRETGSSHARKLDKRLLVGGTTWDTAPPATGRSSGFQIRSI